MSLVVFHRNFQRFQGGHLKAFHYFEHVRSTPSHEARIRFSADSVWDDSNPWLHLRDYVIGPDEDVPADVLFLAGADWRWLTPDQRAHQRLPIINLIQYMARPGDDGPLNGFLVHPAVRICVSPEIQERLEASNSVPGPIFTIPVGLDLQRLPQPRGADERDIDCLVVAIKDPPLGRRIAARLRRDGFRVLLVDDPVPRDELLDAMARTRVAVHLPLTVEGSPLPPLESMALRVAVVCPDCVGNRSYCRDGDTCLVPKRNERAIVDAARSLLSASEQELAPMLDAAYAESMTRTLSSERERFLEILDRADELWTGC